MLTELWPLPWYTIVLIIALGIVGLGLLFTLVRAVVGVIVTLFRSTWVLLCWGLAQVTGWRLGNLGTAHWATRLEMRRARLFRGEGLQLGTYLGRPVYEPTNGHMALFGPPRTKKSWSLLMPNIVRYPGSCLVNDLRSPVTIDGGRGELYEETWAARAARGPVYRYAPSQKESDNYNLLSSVRFDSNYEYGDLHRMADHLYSPSPRQAPNPFAEAAIPLAIAIWLHCHHLHLAHFPGVVEWMTAPDRELEDKLEDLRTSFHPLVQAGARQTLDQSERFRATVWNYALAPLSVFQDPLVASHSRTSDFSLDDFTGSAEPITVYLSFGLEDVARLGVVLGCFVDGLVNRLGSPHTPPLQPVCLFLDEVDNVGHLPELERAISYLQGSGTQVCLVYQNLKQHLKTFGPDSPLLASIATQVHYTPIDNVTATHVSDMLGQSTVTSTSVSSGVNALVGSALRTGETRTDTPAARPLYFPDEVRRIPNSDAVVLTQGCAPVYLTKLDGTRTVTRRQQAQQWLWYHPRLALSAACLLLLTLAVWPLLTPGVRHVPGVMPAALTPTPPWPDPSSGVSYPAPSAAPAAPRDTLAPDVRAQLATPTPGTWRMVWEETIHGQPTQSVKRDNVSEADCQLYVQEAVKVSMATLRQQPTVTDVQVDEAGSTWHYKQRLLMGQVEPRRGRAWCEDATTAPPQTLPLPPSTAATREQGRWRVHSREPYHRDGHSITGFVSYVTRTDCLTALAQQVEPQLKLLQNPNNKFLGYTLAVDRSQEGRIAWTLTYKDTKPGGLPVAPGTTETHERWCAKEASAR